MSFFNAVYEDFVEKLNKRNHSGMSMQTQQI